MHPSTSSLPSETPTLSHSPAYCTDRPGWYDYYGWTCETYETYDYFCSYYGDNYAGEGGLTANEACCGKLKNVFIFKGISLNMFL